MATGDKIVTATVVFVVPEKLVEKLNAPGTLFNVDMLVDKGTYLRANILEKTDLAIRSISDTDGNLEKSTEYDDVLSPHSMMQYVIGLYRKNPTFQYITDPEDNTPTVVGG